MRAGMAWLGVGLLLLGGAGAAAAEGLKPATRISQDLAELLSPRAAGLSVWADEGVIESPMTPIPDVVTIDAVASGDPAALEAELIALGAQDTAIAGRMVSARIPLAAIPFLDSVTSLQFARAAQAVTNVGSVTSQGDKVLHADIARGLYGVDGTGVLVGVLSDSYNCLGGATVDMATGDLPPSVLVLQESSCGQNAHSDEGRAMLQIVHDVAPGASLAFATAFGGQAGFANNILALRDRGAKVIVDDVGYFAEPMFQDGVIAQAVDDVKATGVAYFSAAGNQARQAYEHAFVPGQVFAPGHFGDALHRRYRPRLRRHRHAAHHGSPRTSFTLALQWDSPFFSVSGPAGTPNDLDIYILQDNRRCWRRPPTTWAKDPVEILDRRVQWHGHVRRLHHDRQSRRPGPGAFQVRVLRRQPPPDAHAGDQQRDDLRPRQRAGRHRGRRVQLQDPDHARAVLLGRDDPHPLRYVRASGWSRPTRGSSSRRSWRPTAPTRRSSRPATTRTSTASRTSSARPRRRPTRPVWPR